MAKPGSYDYNIYNKDNSSVSLNEGEYTIDPDANGPASQFSFDNPDFNFVSLRGNAVLRWEYLPGSTLYFVWTQSRSNSIDDGMFNFNKSFNRMFDLRADNIFMIKLNYWLNM